MSNPIVDLRLELLAAAERQLRDAAVPARRRPFEGRVVVTRAVVVGATLAAAAAAALFVTAPWSSSPSFLARAEAALTPPEGMILHAKMAKTTSPRNIYCTSVTRTAEIWVDERTQRYRGLFHDPYSPYPWRFFKLGEFAKVACSRGTAYEAGGLVPSGPRFLGVRLRYLFDPPPPGLRFVPPNRLVELYAGGAVDTLDPVTDLRHAIRTGRAHHAGRKTLRGRVVERIRIDPCDDAPRYPAPECPDLAAEAVGYAYVDPQTFYPVEIRHVGEVTRFDVFEYLPRTAANLALTDIRAQHPDATGP